MKIGIIGCGEVAPAHVQAYQNLKNVEIVSRCDLDINKAKNLATNFRINKTYVNYWDMFEKEDLDLIDICTPVSTHAQIVCDVAETAPAIFLEKPMALTVSDCNKMIKAVEKNGSKLCIGHNQIFSPNIQRAKAMVDSDNFDLHSFSTIEKESFEILKAYNLALPWNVIPEQGGLIWEVCGHLAYLQLHFLPDIKEVYAVGDKIKYPVYDDFTVLLRTSGKHYGMIELSWLSNETEMVYELRDSTGKRVKIYWEFDYFLENSEEPPLTIKKTARNVFVDEKRLLQKWIRFGVCYFRKKKLLSVVNLISKYVECIEKDIPPPVSPEDGRNTISLLECIKKSLDEGRPVQMKSI